MSEPQEYPQGSDLPEGTPLFKTGERMAVWSWDGAHRIIVSVIAAQPHQALVSRIALGGVQVYKSVPWEHLFRRDTGAPFAYRDFTVGQEGARGQ